MGRYQVKPPHENFELDLAPLLAVMVKLVPVLIVSSAFVQVSVIESDLPQVVKEEMQKQNENQNPVTQLVLNVNQDNTLSLTTITAGKVSTIEVKSEAGAVNLVELHKALISVKSQHPSIYKLELKPQPQVPYDTLVKVMDAARRTTDGKTEFPVIKEGKEISKTPYMFPDVVFANVIEG